MTASQHRLVVDFGTSTTIAMLQRPDGRVQPLIFDGSPLLSSAVLLGPDGQLHTGRDAAHLARSAPERLEPNPKRRIDETAVLLGDREIDVRDLIAAVLTRAATEAARVAGPVRDLTLTHPAAWGPGRRAVLHDAAQRAGFGGAELVAEPLAAATYFARLTGGSLPVGACVLVYDLGGGTCDVTVLRRQPAGFEPIASDGLNDVGGLDVDAAVVGFLQATYGELWTSPATRRQVWEDVRSAKEMLSRASSTVIMIPALQKEVPLGREQLEGLTRPVLRGTISMTRTLLVESGIAQDAIAGLFLVGGSSRIPLVATLLHEALGIAPVVAEQPELVVAEGALYVRPSAAPATGAPPVPSPGAPVSPVSASPVSPVSSMPVSPMPSSFSSSPSSFSPPSPLSPMPFAPGSPAAPGQPGGPVRQIPVQPGFMPPRSAQPGLVQHGPPPGSVPPFGGPPVMPPRPPVPPRSGRGGGFIVAIVVGVVVAVLLVIGVPVAVYTMTQKTNKATSSSGPGASNGPSNGATSPASETTGSTSSAKYAIEKIPENLCGVVDTSALNALFEAESGKPSGNRNLSTIFGSATCILSRQHNKSDLPVSVGTLSFSLYVFADQTAAESNQKQTLDNAKLNATTTEVPDLGDTAFIYQVKTNTANPGSEASYTLESRDGNLRWSASVIGSRIDSVSWSDADRKDLQNRLISMAKASYLKATSAMK